MRLFRRNALGVYAVYAAAIVAGLVVTPVVLHEIGDVEFGMARRGDCHPALAIDRCQSAAQLSSPPRN